MPALVGSVSQYPRGFLTTDLSSPPSRKSYIHQNSAQKRPKYAYFGSLNQVSVFKDVEGRAANVLSMYYTSQVDSGWGSYLAEKLYPISGVESVYIGVERDYIDIWIVIPHRDVPTMERIYQAQEDIYEMFSPIEQLSLFFDFHVIYRNGSDEKDLLPSQANLLPK